MQIAAPLELHSQVAAATAGCGCAPAVAAQTPHTAGQWTPAATHPTPPAFGTQPRNDIDARLLLPVGDNELGATHGSGLAGGDIDAAAVDRPESPATKRPSAIPVVAAPPPAMSISPRVTGVHEAIATSVPIRLLRLLRSS
jgi:hypothetical protein